MMRCALTLAFFAAITFVYGQNLGVQEAQSDFDEAVSAIRKLHPEPYNFIPKSDFDYLVSNYRNAIDSTIDEQQLHIILRKLIAKLGCGHTQARPSAAWYDLQRKEVRSLPIRVFIDHERIYLSAIRAEGTKMLPGDEIKSINGMAAAEMLSDMRSIQERDGRHQSFVDDHVERLFSTYFLFLYGPNTSFEIEYWRDGETAIEKVTNGSKKVIGNSNFTLPPHWSTAYEIEDGHFYLSKKSNTALLDIDAFGRRKYKRFYKNVFQQLHDSEIDTLLIDLRQNGGGNLQHGIHILRYLLKEEVKFEFYKRALNGKKSSNVKMDVASAMTGRLFDLMPDHDKIDTNRNYLLTKKPIGKRSFNGHVKVLIDGGSFSMSGYVASQLTKRENTSFYGQESGGGMRGSNAILIYQLTLPNSGIRVRIPHYHLDHLVDESDGGVPVDTIVIPTIVQRINGEDPLLKELLRLE